MGLKSLKFPEATIETAGGPLTVRGLNLPNILTLVRNHGAHLAAMFTKVMEQGEAGLDLATVQAMGSMALATVPRCVGEIIAFGAGEDDDEAIELAMNLPAPVQIEALERIAKLTFETEGGPKKVVEAVIRALQGTTGLVDLLKSHRL